MDRGTEHERPAKRAKRDKEEEPPIGHSDDDSDAEGPGSGSIADNGAAHGSDLYLDTVRDTPIDMLAKSQTFVRLIALLSTLTLRRFALCLCQISMYMVVSSAGNTSKGGVVIPMRMPTLFTMTITFISTLKQPRYATCELDKDESDFCAS